ncbi:MAG: cation transporter [Porticoccaceae bacterium]|nr:cation transporter [Porticoccaceae bacterium]
MISLESIKMRPVGKNSMLKENMSQGADPLKSIFYALFANGAIARAKVFAAWLTGSGAMLAEAIHSLADCSNQLLLWLGIKKAKRVPSSDYPLGYGKGIYFWPFFGGPDALFPGWCVFHMRGLAQTASARGAECALAGGCDGGRGPIAVGLHGGDQ